MEKKKDQVSVTQVARVRYLFVTCSCLAHVINLATQSLISSYSKSPHFDPVHPEAHVPTTRDEVGLVRAIVVKVSLVILFIKLIDVAYCCAGTFVLEAKRNVEDDSKEGK